MRSACLHEVDKANLALTRARVVYDGLRHADLNMLKCLLRAALRQRHQQRDYLGRRLQHHDKTEGVLLPHVEGTRLRGVSDASSKSRRYVYSGYHKRMRGGGEDVGDPLCCADTHMTQQARDAQIIDCVRQQEGECGY